MLPLCAPPFSLSEGWVGVPSFPARGQHLRCTTLCTPPFSLRGVGGGTQFPCEGAAPPVLPLCTPPMGGPTRPTPGVPFVSRRKEPKACRGCAPGPREGGTLSPLRRRRKASRNPPQWGFQTQQKTDLPTHSKRANRSFVLPQFLRGNTFGC